MFNLSSIFHYSSSDRYTQNVRVLVMLSRNHNFFKVYWFFYRYSNTLKTTTEDYYHWARKSRQTTTTTITPRAATHMRKISIEWAIISLKFKSFTTTKKLIFCSAHPHTWCVCIWGIVVGSDGERRWCSIKGVICGTIKRVFLSMFEEDIYSVCWCEDSEVPIYDLHQLKIYFFRRRLTDKRARDSLKKAIQFAFQFYVNSRWESRACVNFFQRKI